jgi:small neutral amino acid transporter SnatA (MarC family)
MKTRQVKDRALLIVVAVICAACAWLFFYFLGSYALPALFGMFAIGSIGEAVRRHRHQNDRL